MRHSSSTAVVRVAPVPDRPWEVNDEQMTILKNSVAKGASDAELQFCLTVSVKRYKLDPFKQGQIWFIKRWDKNADNGHGGTGAYIWTPQVGIYGMAHIAGRDHKDYGSISLPEYGPTIEVEVEGKKLKGSCAWARVKAFKKGIAEPSYGEAWLEEYCPKRWKTHCFGALCRGACSPNVRRLRRCAKLIRDLGGLYIPEECARMNEDFTPSGRQITDANGFSPSGQPITYEARQQRPLDENLRNAYEPGSAKHAQVEAVMASVEEEDGKSWNRNPKRFQGSNPGREAAHVDSQVSESDGLKPSAAKEKPASIPKDKPRGTIELDMTDVNDVIIRGDIGDLLEIIKKHCTATWGSDSWWHILPADVATIHAMGDQLNYRVVEILPKRVPSLEGKSEGLQPKAGTAAQGESPSTVTGKESVPLRRASGTTIPKTPDVGP